MSLVPNNPLKLSVYFYTKLSIAGFNVQQFHISPTEGNFMFCVVYFITQA